MNLPIKFPAWEDVIAEDVKKYQSLSQDDRIGELEEMLGLYDFQLTQSPNREAIERFAESEEAAARAAVMEFASRHGV